MININLEYSHGSVTLVIKTNNTEIREDVTEFVWQKDKNGKSIIEKGYKKRIYKSVIDMFYNILLEISNDLNEEYNSGELIKSLFKNLSEIHKNEIIKDLNKLIDD